MIAQRTDLPKEIASIGKDYLRELFFKMKKEQYTFYKKYLKRNGKHLDIGSGDGITALYIKMKNPTISVDMLDIQKDNLDAKVKRRLKKDSLFRHTIYLEKDSFLFSEKIFDSISLFYVLHHCGKRGALKLLKESHRVLNDNGKVFILEEPAGTDFEKDLLREIDREIDKVFNQDRTLTTEKEPTFFSEKNLRKLFNQAGFQIIKTFRPSIKKQLFPRKIYILEKSLS